LTKKKKYDFLSHRQGAKDGTYFNEAGKFKRQTQQFSFKFFIARNIIAFSSKYNIYTFCRPNYELVYKIILFFKETPVGDTKLLHWLSPKKLYQFILIEFFYFLESWLIL